MSCSAKRDPNGTWHIQYRWTDWTGTKKKSQKRGFKTKKEAEEWYAHFILQQTSDPTMTLNDFWEIYKADMEKRLRKTTMKQKEYVMKDKVLPYFGNTPINAISLVPFSTMRYDSMNYVPIHATKQAVWGKVKRMNVPTGRWKNFRNFQTQSWIKEIRGWHFRYCSGQVCVSENYLPCR